MNIMEKSESIRAGMWKGFQDGASKMAQRRCYGYDTSPDGKLVINPDEAVVVRWIFERCLNGDSLSKIATGLEQKGILSPTGKPKWNREALNKLLSNEKYTGRVLLQKTISTGISQIKNDGILTRYLISNAHDSIISDEIFKLVQQEKMKRTNSHEVGSSMQMCSATGGAGHISPAKAFVLCRRSVGVMRVRLIFALTASPEAVQ